MSYDNTNSGALFKNKEKDNEKHPDYRGSLNVGGTEFWISSWLKTSKAGEKYMSLSVQPKQAPAKPVPPKRPDPADNYDPFEDSEVPF